MDDSVAQLDDLDLDASVEDSVTVVEWGEGVAEQLADAHLEVRIQPLDDESRLVDLVPHGGDWAGRVTDVTDPRGKSGLRPHYPR